MKSNILIASLFIALMFAQVLSSLALDSETLSKHRVRSSDNGHGHGRDDVVKEEEMVDTVYSVKGQRGRGGSSDITRKPSRSGSTERSLLTGPSTYISMTALSCLSLFILQIFGF